MKRLNVFLAAPLLCLGLTDQVVLGDTNVVPSPHDAVPTLPSETGVDIPQQIKKANGGNLAAAKGLFAHYCLYEYDDNACIYWTVRSAQLGDEHMRCTVIEQYKDYGVYASYKATIQKLMKKGKCKE